MRTILADCMHEIIIEKSRFICYLKKTNDINVANEFIRDIKKKHYDATHNCTALIVGDFNPTIRSNDDGEPSGTAGSPMLEVLKKNNLTNVACVVTRYFGGIKLGAGGLVRAYSSSVSECLNHSFICDVTEISNIYITFDYNFISSIEKILNTAIYSEKEFLEKVHIKFGCFNEDVSNYLERLNEITSGELIYQILEKSIRDVVIGTSS